MKKILLAIGAVAAMVLVSSCSADSLDNETKENAINKNEILHTGSINAVSQDTIPQTNTSPIDDGNPVRP